MTAYFQAFYLLGDVNGSPGTVWEDMIHLRKRLIISGSAVLVLTILVLAAITGYKTMLLPVNAGAASEVVLVDIPAGASAREIAILLEKNGIIRNADFFRFYARWVGRDEDFLAGSYRLNPAMSMREIMDLIIEGTVYHDTIWLVVPEGSTVEQIAAFLLKESLIDEVSFLELCAAPPPSLLESFPFLLEVAANSAVRYPLEGYLFPDTYEIERGTGAEEIATLMLQRFETVISRERSDRAAELGLTLHQLLTLASIVEREAVVDTERGLIAAVFQNRLHHDHFLQSCATIQYILGETKTVLTGADLALESPYNTYLHPGLPPGPIAAPGEKSLEAALFPEETDYFYFNARDDGSGGHYFSSTLEEHHYHIGLAEQNRAGRSPLP